MEKKYRRSLLKKSLQAFKRNTQEELNLREEFVLFHNSHQVKVIIGWTRFTSRSGKKLGSSSLSRTWIGNDLESNVQSSFIDCSFFTKHYKLWD